MLVFIVEEDIDLLVLITVLSHPNIFLRKPGTGKIVEKLYFPKHLQYEEIVADNTLFLHAFSGCDTTSAVFNIGKIKSIKSFEKN